MRPPACLGTSIRCRSEIRSLWGALDERQPSVAGSRGASLPCLGRSTRWARSSRLMWSREARRCSFGVPLLEASPHEDQADSDESGDLKRGRETAAADDPSLSQVTEAGERREVPNQARNPPV